MLRGTAISESIILRTTFVRKEVPSHDDHIMHVRLVLAPFLWRKYQAWHRQHSVLGSHSSSVKFIRPVRYHISTERAGAARIL